MLGWFSRKPRAAPVMPPGAGTAHEAGRPLPVKPAVWGPTAPLPISLPLGEAALQRDAELRRLAALQARGAAAYLYLAETAARICDTPLAAIALLEGDTLWFKASIGIVAAAAPAASSPCLLTIERGAGVTVIDDPASDARFAGHPFLAADPPIRFYAGTPLITALGVAVGTLSVGDHRPRELSPVQLRTLELLAHEVVQLLEARAPRDHP